jgi:2-polyprenyl-3-methyl-5-hydroxy-6-metoxy-1,4-benzoquinol methylase
MPGMSERYRETVDPAAPNSAHAMAIRMVGHDRRVLEVGCSVGHVTEHLVANGNDVVGVEIDPSAAEEARRFATAVHVADLDRTPLEELAEGPFDVIVFGDVLEHLRDPSAALDAAVRLLADGGHVVVSIPNVAHADVRLMLLEGRWEYQEHGLLDDTHLRFFTREGLRALLAGSGLVATEIDRVTIPMFATNLPVTPDLHGEALRRFVLADPEALTFQFVVTARRRDGWQGDDVLGRPPPQLDPVGLDEVPLRNEVDELRAMLAEREAHEAALVTELEAWRNSTLARVSRPLRAAWGRIAPLVRR